MFMRVHATWAIVTSAGAGRTTAESRLASFDEEESLAIERNRVTEILSHVWRGLSEETMAASHSVARGAALGFTLYSACMPPFKCPLTWQWNSHVPGLSGTMSATIIPIVWSAATSVRM